MPTTLSQALAEIDAEQSVARARHERELDLGRGVRFGGMHEDRPFHELSPSLRLEMAKRRVAERNADTQANRDAKLRQALRRLEDAGDAEASAIYSAMCRDPDKARGRAEAFLGVRQAKAA